MRALRRRWLLEGWVGDGKSCGWGLKNLGVWLGGVAWFKFTVHFGLRYDPWSIFLLCVDQPAWAYLKKLGVLAYKAAITSFFWTTSWNRHLEEYLNVRQHLPMHITHSVLARSLLISNCTFESTSMVDVLDDVHITYDNSTFAHFFFLNRNFEHHLNGQRTPWNEQNK